MWKQVTHHQETKPKSQETERTKTQEIVDTHNQKLTEKKNELGSIQELSSSINANDTAL